MSAWRGEFTEGDNAQILRLINNNDSISQDGVKKGERVESLKDFSAW
jgi:hypothetical protein